MSRRWPERPAPLRLSAGDLDAARLALAGPEPRRGGLRPVLAGAAMMTAAALALCAVVLLNDGSPQASAQPASIRRAILR